MIKNWIKADWPAPNYIKAGTTLRQGGVSKAPYDSLNLGGACWGMSSKRLNKIARY